MMMSICLHLALCRWVLSEDLYLRTLLLQACSLVPLRRFQVLLLVFRVLQQCLRSNMSW
jgi:hypothetical protein